ncbi:MAG: hypothetical protein QW666_01500 [Candidatus Woesearchaeota archaeon]
MRPDLKEVAGRQESKDLEAVVATFWNREFEEKEAKKISGWTYITAAQVAYERRAEAEYAYTRKDLLEKHKFALEFKKKAGSNA